MNARRMTVGLTVVLALALAWPRAGFAGERQWATAGKVLTGVFVAGLLAPILVQPAPATVYTPPPVYCAPPPVYYVPPPVYYYAPPPVYCAPPVWGRTVFYYSSSRGGGCGPCDVGRPDWRSNGGCGGSRGGYDGPHGGYGGSHGAYDGLRGGFDGRGRSDDSGRHR
jgi:hypothetical protein